MIVPIVLNTLMKPRLCVQKIDQIQSSTEPVRALADRLGISMATVCKYRPSRRRHVNDAETDQIILEWLAQIPTRDTATRLGVTIQTIQTARRRVMADLIREISNGSA